MSPGIHHKIPFTEYAKDPCVEPSLSASIAKSLLNESPLHAWTKHPRLNPNWQPEHAAHFDLGKLCHALMLEGLDNAVVIDAENYRTKVAQEARDAARAAGKCPILKHEVQEVSEMMVACRSQLAGHQEARNAFIEGQPEVTLVWQEFTDHGPIWCRARLDWLHDSHLFVDDYKTSSGSVHPDQITRTMYRDGWDIQAVFYMRGLWVLNQHDPCQFRFVCQEMEAPFALSVVSCGPAAIALANSKVEFAIRKYAECLHTEKWPGYTDRIAYADLPAYEETRWLQREEK